MAANTQLIAALEQRITDLEAEIREFRLDTVLEAAGIAFSAGRESTEKYAAAAAVSQRRPGPEYLRPVGGDAS